MFMLSSSHSASDDLKDQLAAAKREDVPVEPNDVYDEPVPASRDNAASDMRAAFAVLQDPTFKKAYGLRHDQHTAGPPEFDRAKIESILALGAPAITSLEAASKKPRLDYGRNWSLGPNLLFPELADSKRAVSLLVDKAILLNAQGKRKESLQTLQAAGRVSALIGQEPTIISNLVQVASEVIVQRGLESILPDDAKDPDLLDEAEKVVDSFGGPPNIRHAIRGELPSSIIAITMLEKDPKALGEMSGSSFPNQLFRVASVRNRMEARLIENWRGLYKELPSDPLNFDGARTAFKNMSARIDKHAGEVSYYLAGILGAEFSGSVDAMANAEAGRRILRQAIQIYRHSKAKPEIDPFGNRPLRVKQDKADFRIYSIGRDFSDDGGKPRDPKSHSQTTDTVFVFAKK